MLKQLGTIDTGERIELPAFDYAFALASIVGGRLKIDGDPLGVGVDLAIDALFFQWLARNKEKIGRALYASSTPHTRPIFNHVMAISLCVRI